MRIIKTFESFNLLNEKNPCWKGYKQVGTKMKNGKEVPNCVPVKESKNQKYKDDSSNSSCSGCGDGNLRIN